MPTIDELGSHAAAQLSDQVRAGTDVEARLAELHASGATVLPLRRRVPPRVWSAAASVAIIAIGAIGIVALRSGSGAVAPTPSTTVTPDSIEPSPSTTDSTEPSPSTTDSTEPSPSTTDAPIEIPVFDAAITEVDVEPWVYPFELDGCSGEDYCSIESLADGRLIVFRPSTDSFVVIANDGTTQEIRLDRPTPAYLLAVGPDDIVYLGTRATSDERTDIIAFRLGTSVATEIARAKAVGDPSGDTDIVPTTNGLVAVGCCSFDPIRPDPNAEPLMRWVNRDGVKVTDPRPQIRVETVDSGEGAASGVAFVREDANGTVTRWPATGGIPALIRGMPGVAPLDDGGAIVVYDDMNGASGRTYLRLKPNGAIERTMSTEHYAFPIRSGALYGWRDGSFEQIVLATFTDPVDALGDDLPTGSSADDVIQQLVAQLLPQSEEQGDCVTSVRVVSRTGTDPVIATIASRNPCDDSVGGQNLTYTIGSDADGPGWGVQAATEAYLCLRGTDGVLCT